MIEDEPFYGDDARRLADFWIDEFGAGVLSANELRELLSDVLPGSLSTRSVGPLYWDQVVSWAEACRLIGRSPMLSRRGLFGTRLAQAAECGCTFEASSPREIADPPDWCPNHRPVIRSYPQYLRSEHWQRFRTDYLRRHPFCEHDHKRRAVEVHHTPEGYHNLGHETDDDVLALCRLCHAAAHRLVVEVDE